MTEQATPPQPVESERSRAIARRFTIPATAAAALVAAVSLSAPLTMASEGEVNVAKVDKIGRGAPPTTCFGHTGPEVRVGVRYSHAQCEVLLEEDQTKHAAGVYRASPAIARNVFAFAAATDFAFNLGVGTYARSTAARRFAAGDFAGGCAALGPSFEVRDPDGRVRVVRGYVKSLGQVRRGLVIRRDRDFSLCRTGRWQ